MERINFNKDWLFTFENNLDAYNEYGLKKNRTAKGAAAVKYPFSNWDKIDLPHDFVVGLPKDLEANTFNGGRNNSKYHRYTTEGHSDAEEIFGIGWYRKEFPTEESWAGKRVFVEFEGVFRDSDIFFNGTYLDNHKSGYTSFILELTDYLEAENSLAVRVDSTEPEGWFYEGGGIYRNVNLIVCEPVYIKPNETFIKTKNSGAVSVSSVIVNDTERTVNLPIEYKIYDKVGAVCACAEKSLEIPAYSEREISAELTVHAPQLWDVDTPNLYTLEISACDTEKTDFGFREITFDSSEGCFINGRHIKIRGACVHQDFGGVGTALTDNLNRYKIAKLKEMGVNSYRCSHNPPSPALLRACDELGMLVMDETRAFGTSPEALRQLESLIKRDRNHPSVFIWCIGNEEVELQNTTIGQKIAERLIRFVRKLDDTRPTTYAGNNSAQYEGINAVVDIRGLNYLRSLTKPIPEEYGTNAVQYHTEHPHQPILGSEESSYVLSRGGAYNDIGNGIIDSSGNCTMPWATSVKGWVKYYEERPFIAGGYMWTGFDYRGEPNPLWFTALSSSFGTIDLCGMEKPPYHYYRAWWKSEPVLKLTPHWNGKRGEIMRISVFTNCSHVTLEKNGKLFAECDIERFDAPVFEIPFEPGELTVRGIKDGVVYTDKLKTAGAPKTVEAVEILPCERAGDIGIIELVAKDKDGNICHTAENSVTVTLRGGDIVGIGNGSPTDEGYEVKPREEEFFYIRSFRAEYGQFAVKSRAKNMHRAFAVRTEEIITLPERTEVPAAYADDYRDVIRMTPNPYNTKKTFTFTANPNLTENYEYIEFERLHGEADVYLDGKLIGTNRDGGAGKNNRPYRFGAKLRAGSHEIKLVTTLTDGTIAGCSGDVKLGREVNKNVWRTRLNYGRARVFVKYDSSYKITAKLDK